MRDRQPTIVQYWHATPVPGDVARLIATFREHNPDLLHLLFDEARAERFIAERIGEREAAAFRACASPTMQADYFRCCFVLASGGIYADADHECLRPLRPLLEGCDGGEIFLGPTHWELNGREANRIWNSLFVFSRPGHPFLELAMEIATANIESRLAERIWRPGERPIESVWLTAGAGVFTLLRFMRAWGSLEAFVEGVAGSVIEPFAGAYCDVVGDYERVRLAFEGVRVSPFERMSRWVAHPDPPPGYKDTDAHWHNLASSIFR